MENETLELPSVSAKALPKIFKYFPYEMFLKTKIEGHNLYDFRLFTNLFQSITKESLSKVIIKDSLPTVPSIEKNRIMSFELHKAYGLHLYYDFTCCGINHLGGISSIQSLGIITEKHKSQRKEFFSEIFTELDTILYRYYFRYVLNKLYLDFDGVGYPECKNRFSIEEFIKGIESTLKSNKFKSIKIKATTGLNETSKKSIEQDITSTSLISPQQIFHSYLTNSTIFKPVNSFININSNNTVTEFEAIFSAEDILNSLLEMLIYVKEHVK